MKVTNVKRRWVVAVVEVVGWWGVGSYILSASFQYRGSAAELSA